MNIRIIGVTRNIGQGILGSPYVAEELSLLGFDVTQITPNDDSQFEKAFIPTGDETLYICALSGVSHADTHMIKLIAHACKVGLTSVGGFSIPATARPIPGKFKGMPGFEINGVGARFLVLPEDPDEQLITFFDFIYPELSKNSPCAIQTVGVMELPVKKVESVLRDILDKKNPCVAIYPKKSEVAIRISTLAHSKQESISSCASMTNLIIKRLGNFAYGKDVNSISHALVLQCMKKGLKLAIAESADNDFATKKISAEECGKNCIALSKSFFPESLDLPKLGISEKIGKKFGVVSANVAAAMALGATKENPSCYIGIGVSLPNSNIKSSTGYVAACMGTSCIVKPIEINNYESVSEMIDDASDQAINLGRKFADSYPNAPVGSASAEDTVLQGMATFGVSSGSTAFSQQISLQQEEETLSEQSKPKGFKKIISAIFPNKADSGFDKFRKIAILMCGAIFMGSMIYLVSFKAGSVKSEQNISNLQQQMADAEEKSSKEPLSNIEGYPPEYLPKFASFYKENEDIKGWIKIPNTNVNFPVVQTADNDFYHRLGFNKEYDYYGTPYLDYEVDVKKPSTNTIIYGHNIKADGQMFNDLTKYKNLDFYKNNPVVNFDSVYETGSYKIIGAFITNAEPDQDEGKTFEYTHFVDAKSQEDFDAFISEVKKRSMFNTTVDVKYGDELLTLSTCTYEFRPEARFAVVARRVRDGESEEVDTDKAVMNPNVYYPKAYRDALKMASMYGQVKGISIQNKKNVSLKVGETTTLSAKVSPDSAPIKTYIWDSSNKAVATVDKAKGVITAIAAGESVITVQADDGGAVDNVKVTVTATSGAAATKLSISPATLSLKPSATGTLTASFTQGGSSVPLTWKSSDESIAKVSGNNASATVSAIGAGTATITASSEDGKLTAKATVTVLEEAKKEEAPVNPATAIVFSTPTLELPVGQSQTLKLNQTPTDSSIGTVEYTFDTNKVTVTKGSENTVIVKGSSVGSGTLTAKTSSGLTATCKIKVVAVDATDANLSLSDLTLISGEEGKMPYTVTPEDTVLTWMSSDPRLADVDSTGYVTTMPDLETAATVTITASNADGSLKQSAIVTIEPVSTPPPAKPKPDEENKDENTEGNKDEDTEGNKDENTEENKDENKLKVIASPIQVEINASGLIPISVNSSSLADTKVTCTTNSNLIDVDNEGYVTAYGAGTADVTIVVEDFYTGESVSETVTVTIIDPANPINAEGEENRGYGGR